MQRNKQVKHFSIIALAMVATAALAETPTQVSTSARQPMTIGTEPGFAPYIFLNAAGQITGFDRDMGDELCLRAQFDCTWVATDFSALIPDLAAGQFDLVIAGLTDTPERRQWVDFSSIYLPGGTTNFFVGRPGAPEPDRARIAVQAGTLQEARLIALGYTPLPFPSNQAALQAVIDGSADLAFGADTYMQHATLALFRDLQVLGRDIGDVTGASIALAQHNDALRDRLDAVLAAMRADGTMDRLAAKWFPVEGDT
jgi:polar amino acid transport system substrate-binding protein